MAKAAPEHDETPDYLRGGTSTREMTMALVVLIVTVLIIAVGIYLAF